MEQFVAPYSLMREVAHAMDTDTQNLLAEQQEYWQRIQIATSSLPPSIQSIFNPFLASNGPHLTDGLILRQQIGLALSRAADLTEDVDHDVAQMF